MNLGSGAHAPEPQGHTGGRGGSAPNRTSVTYRAQAYNWAALARLLVLVALLAFLGWAGLSVVAEVVDALA